MTYYPDHKDPLWNFEVDRVMGYCRGVGADVGCGRRTLGPHCLTVDWQNPDAQIHARAESLPFESESLDFVYAGHVIEHCENPLATVREWLRVVKPLGYVVIICPDRRGTPPRGSTAYDAQHKGDYVAEELVEILSVIPDASIINRDFEALRLQDGRPWSFKVIMRKHGRSG